MGTINTARKSRTETERHANWMGGPSYFVSDPVRALHLAASSCFFGEPMYYHAEDGKKTPARKIADPTLSAGQLKHLRATLNAVDPVEWRGLSPAELMVSAIDKALDHDVEATLKLAVELRGPLNIRTTPQVILVRAAHHPKARGTGLVRKYAREICVRADEPAVGLAYHLATYGAEAPIPNALKKGWALVLESCSEYELAKYRMESRQVKLVDVARLCHPGSEAVAKLMKGDLRTTGKTWEAIVSKKGSNKAAWEEALGVMGHMALLRNLRNLTAVGIPLGAFRDQLVAGVPGGKQLPFRYFSAYKALQKDGASGPLLDVVEECLKASLGNLPKLPGRGMFLCDNSGSAWGTTTSSMGTMHVAEIANLTACIGAQLCDEGYIGVFGDELREHPIRRGSSVFDQVEKACHTGRYQVGGGTENGVWLFWDKAIREKQHWDTVFIMSDMQAGHGGLFGSNPGKYLDFLWPGDDDEKYIDVGKLVNAYRARVNPKVDVFLVQVAGYQGTLLPEFYERTYILGGWSDNVLRFAAEMAKLGQHQA